MLKRGVTTIPTGTSRSVVRVLSSTSTGKSLISPHALKSATPPPTPGKISLVITGHVANGHGNIVCINFSRENWSQIDPSMYEIYF